MTSDSFWNLKMDLHSVLKTIGLYDTFTNPQQSDVIHYAL